MKRLFLLGLGLLALAAENLIVINLAQHATRDRLNTFRDREEADLRRQIATLVEDASTPDRSQFIIRPPFPTWQEQLREREIEAHEAQAAALQTLADQQANELRRRQILGQ